MTDSALSPEPLPTVDAEAAVLAQWAALQAEGGERLDPPRWHFLQALAERMKSESGAVRPILRDKLERAVADYSARLNQARQTAAADVTRLSAQRPAWTRELKKLFTAGDYNGVRRLDRAHRRVTHCAPLTELNQYLQSALRAGSDATMLGSADSPREMKSLERFRATWSRLSAEEQLEKAIGRAPENAGPLNTHMLVLRSLTMMNDLSPDYLWRYLSQVDTLLWLEQAGQRTLPAEGKAVRRSRHKK